jgi:hypothetical protein
MYPPIYLSLPLSLSHSPLLSTHATVDEFVAPQNLFQKKARLLVHSLHALRVTVPAMLDEAVEKAEFINALSADPVDRIPSEVQTIMKVTSLRPLMKSLGLAFDLFAQPPSPSFFSPPLPTGCALTGSDS